MRDMGLEHHSTPAPRRLTVDAVSLALDGAVLLEELSFALPETGCTIVMGPNGAGKTLLLRVLHGLVQPSSGAVLWGGAPPEDVRARQSMVMQHPVLLRRSTIENLHFVLRARGLDSGHAPALLEQVGLASKAQTPARRLSGGERQRLALARALATKPDVLFLDEPTASLDPTSSLIMERIIVDVRDAGTRVICVSHSRAQAQRIGTDVLFLHRGRMVEQASVERFFSAPSSDLVQQYLAGGIIV